METKLKDIENEINNLIVDKVTIDSILQIKELSEKIKKLERVMYWIYFTPDLDSIDLTKYNLKLDSSVFDKKENPVHIIRLIKDAVISTARTLENTDQVKLYKDFNIELSKLYIKHEDYQEEIEEKTYYLYEMIDEKFSYLDEDPEFIRISELLDKIAKEVFEKVSAHIENKRKFYEDYFKENFNKLSNNTMSTNSELFVDNFIKNYILKNFGQIFNQVCLDVLELNGIKEENEIKKFISLYYDYTKQITKLMLSATDIDKRIKMFENLTGKKIDEEPDNNTNSSTSQNVPNEPNKPNNPDNLEDGQLEFDDKGIRCYWDNEIKGWVCSPEEASERFLQVLKSRNDFEGFDAHAHADC